MYINVFIRFKYINKEPHPFDQIQQIKNAAKKVFENGGAFVLS